MSYEKGTELAVVGQPVKEAFEKFAAETGRKLRMEIEPGTYLLANSCALLSTVQDIVTTGAEGHTFLKLDSGMTEVLRPSLYGMRARADIRAVRPPPDMRRVPEWVREGCGG